MTDDLAVAASIGLDSVRIDVPWALAQPRAGVLDGDVVEAVLSACVGAADAGLRPWLRLLQPAVPVWFDDEGGFADARNTGRFWPRWVESCADVFGDVVSGWVPIEAPFAMARRLIPDDPRRHGELVETLVVAWRDAWRILRGGPPVMTSLDVAVVRAPEEATPEQLAETNRIDQLRWGVWLDGLRDGRIDIPGRALRELADLDGACDIVGLAIREDAETVLYRAAEQGPERPLALTFRPTGSTDVERSRSIEAMWRSTRRAAEELSVTSVTITPFVDHPPVDDGIVTTAGELKSSGESFIAA